MDSLTAEILSWDLGHLTQQQIEHLHALKAQAMNKIARDFLAQHKGA